MKKFFTLALVCVSISSYAQLDINDNGNVAIRTSETPISPLSVLYAGEPNATVAAVGTKTAISAKRRGNYYGWGYSFYGTTTSAERSFNMGVRGEAFPETPMESGRSYGVCGIAGNSTDGWNYGVYGSLKGNKYGAGIFGTTKDNFGSLVDGKYAGFFDGNTKVKGNLTVTGNISGVILSNAAPTSSSPAYKSMNVEQPNYSEKLSSLSTTEYFIEEKATASPQSMSADSMAVLPEKTIIEEQALEKVHYGLSVDDLKEQFPELVYEKEDGSEGVNYIEMIPILVSTINELNNRIATLEQENAKQGKTVFEAKDAESATGLRINGEPSISQNSPNPCNASSEVSCTIPDNTSNAAIYIYDLTGKVLDTIQIDGRGTTTATIETSGLAPAMYLYSLVCDGKVIDTKRMIVSK